MIVIFLKKIDFYCVNIKGRVRTNNEDNFYALGRFRKENELLNDIVLSGEFKSDDSRFLAVFDGMGGEACGETASFIASVETSLYKNSNIDSVAVLRNLCSTINGKICEYAAEHSIECMGTTAAILYFQKNDIYVCNVGDSRIYHCTGKKLSQISVDHSVPMHGIKKAPLTQFLGMPNDEIKLEPFIAKGNYKSGDRFLICSDGITDMISDEEIEKIISESKPLSDCTNALVSRALINGGIDNITAILCEIRRK